MRHFTLQLWLMMPPWQRIQWVRPGHTNTAEQTRPDQTIVTPSRKQSKSKTASVQVKGRWEWDKGEQREKERERVAANCGASFDSLLIYVAYKREMLQRTPHRAPAQNLCVLQPFWLPRERERGREVEDVASSVIVATISGINYLHHGTVVEYYRKFVVEILKTCWEYKQIAELAR